MKVKVGQGQPLIKGDNNAAYHCNCYTFVAICDKDILKAFRESSQLSLSVPTSVIISKLLKYFKSFWLLLC